MSLPSGYTQLEYIQSSGTQYIDTGLTCNKADNYQIKIDCELANENKYAGANGYLEYQASIMNGVRGNLSVTYKNYIETISVDNVVKKTSDWSSFNWSNVKIGILRLGGPNNTWFSANIQSGKIYSCEIYKDDVLQRDYVPCRNQSNEIGLYDVVNNIFYGNAGTGSFVAGAEVKGSHKTLIDGTWYDLKAGKCLVGGTAYSVKNGRVLVNSTGYNIPFSKDITLNTITTGAILYLNESGNPVPFYIAKHDYESGLNGAGRTLVVRKDCYDMRIFASPGADFPQNNYATSSLDSWLRGTYTNFLDIDTRDLIGTTKFYYTPGYGGRVTTLQRTVFQLSLTELGKSESGKKPEGSVLPIASKLQIAYRNGRAVYQWTRSPDTMLSDTVYCLNFQGTLMGDAVNRSYGSRPAFTLPETLGLAQNPDGTYIIAE